MRAVVAGAGPAAVEAVLALREMAPRVHVELLAPDDWFTHRPPDVRTPFLTGPRRRYALAHLAPLGVIHRRAALAAVDAEARILTTDLGTTMRYDWLIVATGAVRTPALDGALTFDGETSAQTLGDMLTGIGGRGTRRFAFVVPPGITWPLPAYELALQTRALADDLGARGVHLHVLTAESRPLEVLGTAASDLLESLLEAAEVGLETNAAPALEDPRELRVGPGGPLIAADSVVALPVLAGRRIPGLPADADGFIPVTRYGAVQGVERVFAAGDGVAGAIKQGGLATQQADAAAFAIAVASGATPRAEPEEPVLRTQLLTGRRSFYIRRYPERDPVGQVSAYPLWYPPAKIAGRRLAPLLERIDRQVPAFSAVDLDAPPVYSA